MKEDMTEISRAQKGLRYKLMVAFSLMSLIPLMVLVYLVINYIFPLLSTFTDISLVVVFAIIIAFLGLALAKRLVEPVIEIAHDTKRIANGQYDIQLRASGNDEVSNLAESINAMSQKIKSNLEELKSYGQKTKEINLEIHKRVVVLSSLLQVTDIISATNMALADVLGLITAKVAQLNDTGFAVFFRAKDAIGEYSPEAYSNLEEEGFEEMTVKDGEGVLGKAVFSKSTLIIDSSSKATSGISEFRKAHSIKNMLAIPIYSGKNTFGIFLVGNRLDDYRFSTDDIDMAKIFAKQITIAIENDILVKRAKELTMKDDLTDLFNKNYIIPRLDEEIKRAIFYQRPCSFIIINIDSYKAFRDFYGEIPSEEMLKKIARLAAEFAGQFGKAARLGADEFAILLPEKNKREAMEMAETIRKKVESSRFVDSQSKPLTVSVGVSENPIDGSTQGEIFKKASDYLGKAKAQGKNKVVG